DRDRLAGAYVEMLPRILYPLMLVVFIGGVVMFLMVVIMPKLTRICAEMDAPLPEQTTQLIDAFQVIDDYSGLLALGVLGVIAAAVLVGLSPTLRWYLPGIGRLTRWEAQGLVLRMLGTLTGVGRPVPEALGLLAD